MISLASDVSGGEALSPRRQAGRRTSSKFRAKLRPDRRGEAECRVKLAISKVII